MADAGDAGLGAALDAAFALHDAGDAAGALSAVAAIAARHAQSARAQAAHASLLEGAGRRAEAEAAYRAALGIDPAHYGALTNLGLLLCRDSDYGPGIALLERAAAAAPQSAQAHLNLGAALEHARRNEEALVAYEAALTIAPDNALAWHDRASAAMSLGMIDAAIAAGERALSLDPQAHDTRWNLSHALLFRGDFARGFEAFEARWQLPSMQAHRRDYATARLARSDLPHLAGKTVFVHAEQGFGDTFQFSRFVPRLAALGARVVLHVQPALTRLYAGFAGCAEIDSWDAPAPRACDFHTPLLSLPHVLGVAAPADLAGQAPYLAAPAALARRWGKRLPQDGRLRVGLVWASGVRRFDAGMVETGMVRNLPLAFLKPLGAIEGLHLLSLQKGEGEDEIPSSGLPLTDWTGEFADFADTAAVIAALDLVIAVDTGLAHLAGAMGKPVWLLIRHESEWRWQGQRSDSDWYPAMRIYRQEAPGDWRAPVATLIEDLQRLVAKRRGAPPSGGKE
ncbi:MAG: tetratricopeptide repeat protein [Burkholderiales bacterium]|nr:tetratricopeptide repeat protein [Burkholderiales bacterium]